MPHDGQRMPYHCTIVQGGSPSPWCVPKPRGLGVRQAAVANSPSSTPPVTPSTSRCQTSSLPPGTLRQAVDAGLVSYALPVNAVTIDGNAVLQLGDGAEAVLAYFREDAPAPVTG